MKKKFFLPLLLITLFVLLLFFAYSQRSFLKSLFISPRDLAEQYRAVPTATPTPRPLTFAEMNERYGPCVFLPTLMFHHIQTKKEAEAKNQTALTVETETFKSQMQYLKSKGYRVLTVADLIAFFDQGTPVQSKSVLLTFDDGYDDFYANAYPILSELGFPATVFLSTGLVDNPGYLSWQQVIAASPSIFFANHTWSHKNMQTVKETIEFEIKTADTQLAERGLNSPKVFSFTYGLVGDYAKTYLQSLGYSLAFSTQPGSTLCQKQRLELPRVRIGNIPLASYGF